VKNSRANLFFRASASWSKFLNNKRYIISTVNSGHPVFQASASWSKILNAKSIFHTAKKLWATLFFRASTKLLQNSEWLKIHIQYSENFQGKFCFQGKCKLLKILNVKSIFNTVKNFWATLFFQGKRKFLKNHERWKNFQCSVYSLGGDPCKLG